ncbi:ABC transporter ATP-binding protein [Sorangium cellulosum]|uniref:Sulfonate ABC transporter ATP-binding protein n=1 Tax=Sorangium cellulosum TaxID=56 RepID=A0A150QV59_SORCE|nr:ABC transporter ATP-binding protein [Sorangium cellulosum]KYF71468.1 sulfonate ABC transporter ATP-binding protein [Sorangium cellulosum]
MKPSARPGIPGGTVEIRGLSVALGAGPRRVEAVRDLDLTVEGGELVSLLGPSGCGKSTILNAVAGYVTPERGSIVVGGERVEEPGPERGMVFQQCSLLPWKTVLNNVGFGLKMRGVPARERAEASRRLLDLVGLSGFEDAYPSQLSGGMQQRVEIARVLINEPRVVLMDEPFSALDAQTRLSMHELLLDVFRQVRTTVLFVTHDIDEAIFLSDRIALMTRRPCRVGAEIAVPFGRPRSAAIVGSSEFAAIKRRCLEALSEERVIAAAPATPAITAPGRRQQAGA